MEIGRSTDRLAKILEVIQQQNILLGELLGYQQQTAITTQLRAEWAQPMTKYLGRIAKALGLQREDSGLGLGVGSGSLLGLGRKKDKGKENGGKIRIKMRMPRMGAETEIGMGTGMGMGMRRK
jgi:hypothetical protein